MWCLQSEIVDRSQKFSCFFSLYFGVTSGPLTTNEKPQSCTGMHPSVLIGRYLRLGLGHSQVESHSLQLSQVVSRGAFSNLFDFVSEFSAQVICKRFKGVSDKKILTKKNLRSKHIIQNDAE